MGALIEIDKPITKLIEVVSNGIGVLYKPRAIRKEADAKAYEFKVLERAKSEALAENKIREAEIFERLNCRLVAKEMKRQNNIDDVVEIAATQLEQSKQVSEEIVDEDWTTRFFDIVQDVSNDDMKNLWGRILAGEVEQPNSYSKRTLELLRNLSKDEADLFVKVSQFVLKYNDYFIFNGKNNKLTQFNITYSDIAKLTEIGLLQAGTFVQKQFLTQNQDRKVGLIYGSIVVILDIKANTPQTDIPISVLSKAGEELLSLVDIKPNIEYIKEMADSIRKEGLTISYSEIKKISDDGTINHKIPVINL